MDDVDGEIRMINNWSESGNNRTVGIQKSLPSNVIIA